MKRGFWLLVGMLITGSAAAMPSEGSEPQAEETAKTQQASNPAVALRAGIDKLMVFLDQDPRPDQSQLAEFLDSEIAPFFDFDYMAKTAGGRLFERMDEEQQAEITAAVKDSFLEKMAEKLVGYGNQQVRFLPPRAGDGGRTAQVTVAILNPGTYPARLDFRLYRNSDNWRVYDVAANGQSAIVHYRRQLMRQVRQQRMRQARPQMRMPLTPDPRPMAPPMRPTLPPPGYGPYVR